MQAEHAKSSEKGFGKQKNRIPADALTGKSCILTDYSGNRSKKNEKKVD
jgi:hypothetical protein